MTSCAPTARGFRTCSLRQFAGHRKANELSEKGSQDVPLMPQLLFAALASHINVRPDDPVSGMRSYQNTPPHCSWIGWP